MAKVPEAFRLCAEAWLFHCGAISEIGIRGIRKSEARMLKASNILAPGFSLGL